MRRMMAPPLGGGGMRDLGAGASPLTALSFAPSSSSASAPVSSSSTSGGGGGGGGATTAAATEAAASSSSATRKSTGAASTREFFGHRSKVRYLEWNCDGKRLASCSGDHVVRVWSVESHREGKEAELKEHTGTVDQVRWQPGNANTLATASLDKSARIWDVRSKKAAVISTKDDNLYVAWHKSGNFIAIGDSSDLISIYDVRTLTSVCTHSFKEEFWMNDALWWRDSNSLLLAIGESKQQHGRDMASGGIQVVNVDFAHKSVHKVHGFPAHATQCMCIRSDPTGKYLATGACDGVIALWDANEMACIKTFVSIDEEINTVAFNGDGTVLAAPSAENTIEMWNTETGDRLPRIQCAHTPCSLAWHPTQNLLAYGSTEETRTSSREASAPITLVTL